MIDLEKIVPLGKQLLVLEQNLDKDQRLQQAVELIAQTLKIYFVGIYLTNSDKEHVFLRAGNGKGGRSMVARYHKDRIRDGYPTDEKIWGFDAGTCAYSNEIQLVNRMITGETSVFKITDGKVIETKNLNEHEIFWSPKLPETRRELFLPLTTSNNVIGVMEIDSNIDKDFSKDEILILDMLASYIVDLIK